jgi:stage V sporulation protein G
MEITEVRVSLSDNTSTRLKAYATITFDNCFVVRNIKIIEGKNGLFVAMPSRKPKAPCPTCHFKNDTNSRYCTQCGTALTRQAGQAAGAGDLESPEAQAHRDIAHPITVEFRQYLQQKVLEAYEAERTRASNPLHAPGSGETEYEAL